MIFLTTESNAGPSLRYNIDQYTTNDQSKFSISCNLNTVELNDNRVNTVELHENTAETINITVKLSPTEGLKE
jgi:hypothetical protein